MSAAKVMLVFVFNHGYERNIPKLEKYYAPRFSKRKYIVPFASHDYPNAIRVVENGYTFSGHIAQAAQHFMEDDVSHYFFVADDLILNPRFNEDNIEEILGLDAKTGWIKSLSPNDPQRYRWHSSVNAAFDLLRPGFDFVPLLPAASAAKAKFEGMGFSFFLGKPRARDISWAIRRARTVPFWFLRLLAMIGKENTYPLLAGYSDFFTVPQEAIHRFVEYCGVFAAMNMFAEVACPTALALACEDVKTELVRGDHFAEPDARRSPDSNLYGTELWGLDSDAFYRSIDYNWERFIAEFPRDQIYLHPVKLSKWEVG